MICYRDMTFCVSSACVNRCGRKLTQKIRKEAWKWWGSKDAPICVSEFCDLEGNPKEPYEGGP